MLTLAIVGRPNVGKSTLFNRLARKQLALVDDRPGLTRDWREARANLFGIDLRIIDTAGLEDRLDESIEGRMRGQTESALEHADCVVFVVDGRAGITPLDAHFAAWLRRKKKLPVILAVNKCEHERAALSGMGEAYALGLGTPVPISAAHGTGMEDLFSALLERFPDLGKEDEAESGEDLSEKIAVPEDLDSIEGDLAYELKPMEEDESVSPLRLAIVGRPNAGKSTLMNALLGEHRVMTGPEAGITRDSIAVQWVYKDRRVRLVDTAGLRKKAKIVDTIEKMSVNDTLRAVRLAQAVVLVLDANFLEDKQDLSIARHVIDEGRILVLAVNKWDLVENREAALQTLRDRLGTSLTQVRDLPWVTISALKGRNLDRLMDAVLTAWEPWNARVSTGKLNRWLSGMTSRHPPPLVNGRGNRIKYIAQINVRPPTFALWVSYPKELPDSYRRYIINGLQEDFGLSGVPIRLLLRTSKNPFSDGK